MDWAASPSRDTRVRARNGGNGAWCARGTRRSLQRGDALVELREGLRDLFPAHVARGRFELPLKLRARQAQRLPLARALRIDRRLFHAILLFLFELVHALLNPRIGINESFASITHGFAIIPRLPFHPAVRKWFSAT